MSLKANLNQIIKDRSPGVFTLQELESYCHQASYKLSNAERRLRASESPNIERVMKNGAIIGYKWTQSEAVRQFFKDFAPKEEKVTTLF